jgi:hypothetical protein
MGGPGRHVRVAGYGCSIAASPHTSRQGHMCPCESAAAAWQRPGYGRLLLLLLCNLGACAAQGCIQKQAGAGVMAWLYGLGLLGITLAGKQVVGQVVCLTGGAPCPVFRVPQERCSALIRWEAGAMHAPRSSLRPALRSPSVGWLMCETPDCIEVRAMWPQVTSVMCEVLGHAGSLG